MAPLEHDPEAWIRFPDGRSYTLEEIKQCGMIRERDNVRIKKYFYVFEDWNISLSPTIEIRSVSPSHEEIQIYQQIVKYDAIENKKQASKAANYLSSLFYIRKDGHHILLTSDAEKETPEITSAFYT